MHLIPISAITVEERQRKAHPPGAHRELVESIRSLGLMHPLVVQEFFEPVNVDGLDGCTHGIKSGGYRLLAGERRLRAISELKEPYRCGSEEVTPGYAACTLFSELSPEEQTEMELHENIKRVEITWQERAFAINKLFELRSRQAGKPATNAAVAAELHEVQGGHPKAREQEVARSRLIAQHASHPGVQNARSLNEAYQIISRETEALFASELAKLEAADAEPMHRFIHGDMRTALAELQDDQFDCILSDPPYGMDADSFGSDKTKHSYVDDPDYALDLGIHILQQGYRLCRQQAYCFIFCDIDLFPRLREYAREFGWQPWRTPLIWDKGYTSGTEPIPGQGFIRSYELILFAIKGGRMRQQLVPDVIRNIPAVRDASHAAAKPVPLYQHLLARSCTPGDRVLDPCCGVGTIFSAASALQLRATGIELAEGPARLAALAALGTPAEFQSVEAL